jgi:hypothetical protein
MYGIHGKIKWRVCFAWRRVHMIDFLQSCTIDLVSHLPRAMFSDDNLDVLIWLLKANDVQATPSLRQLKVGRVLISKLCGVEVKQYMGKLGHTYYVNRPGSIIQRVCNSSDWLATFTNARDCQEMGNPLVRPKIDFFPEDSGPGLTAARQGERWLHEMHPSRGTPMIRIFGQDFFVLEPTMLKDGSVCMPSRWFTKSGRMWGRAWFMIVQNTSLGPRWVIEKSHEVTFDAAQLLLNATRLRGQENRYKIPSVDTILGTRGNLISDKC